MSELFKCKLNCEHQSVCEECNAKTCEKWSPVIDRERLSGIAKILGDIARDIGKTKNRDDSWTADEVKMNIALINAEKSIKLCIGEVED